MRTARPSPLWRPQTGRSRSPTCCPLRSARRAPRRTRRGPTSAAGRSTDGSSPAPRPSRMPRRCGGEPTARRPTGSLPAAPCASPGGSPPPAWARATAWPSGSRRGPARWQPCWACWPPGRRTSPSASPSPRPARRSSSNRRARPCASTPPSWPASRRPTPSPRPPAPPSARWPT